VHIGTHLQQAHTRRAQTHTHIIGGSQKLRSSTGSPAHPLTTLDCHACPPPSSPEVSSFFCICVTACVRALPEAVALTGPGLFSPKTCAVYLGSSPESDSRMMQIAAAGSRRPLLVRGHYCARSNLTRTVQVLGNEAPCRGPSSPKTRVVYLGSSSENDSGIVQIAAEGSRSPLLLRGHYCARSNPTNWQ